MSKDALKKISFVGWVGGPQGDGLIVSRCGHGPGRPLDRVSIAIKLGDAVLGRFLLTAEEALSIADALMDEASLVGEIAGAPVADEHSGGAKD